MTHERGGRPPKIPGLARLSDVLPDRSRPALADHLARNVFFQATASSSHTVLTVGNTQTRTTDELQRVKGVQVGTVSGGTVTVQVQADGRDIFLDALRPVSGGAVQEPTDVYTFPAGTPLSTIIEASSGVPAGTANVVIETEPYELHPQGEQVKLRGGDRLFVSRRRENALANAGANFIESSLVTRTKRRTVAAQGTVTGQQQLDTATGFPRNPTPVPIGPGPGGGGGGPRPHKRL